MIKLNPVDIVLYKLLYDLLDRSIQKQQHTSWYIQDIQSLTFYSLYEVLYVLVKITRSSAWFHVRHFNQVLSDVMGVVDDSA